MALNTSGELPLAPSTLRRDQRALEEPARAWFLAVASCSTRTPAEGGDMGREPLRIPCCCLEFRLMRAVLARVHLDDQS